MKKLKILTGVQERNDYPYGRLKCEIKFWIEFTKGKGFRMVSQTKNPKTGRINNPKKTTYSHFMVLHEDENGHVKPWGFNFWNYEDVTKFIDFIKVNEVEFTPEESSELWTTIISCCRGNAQYTRLREGVEVSELLEAIKAKAMINLYGKGSDIHEIQNIGWDLEAILNLKEDAYAAR